MRAFDFFKSTASTLITRLMIMGLAFLIGVVTARSLVPTDLGAFSISLALPALVSLFLQFGLGVANVYFIGKREYPPDILLGNALTLSLVTTAIVLPLYVLSIPLLQHTVATGISFDVLFLIGLSIPLALVSGHLSYVFLGLQNIEEYNLLKLIRQGSTVILLIIFVIVLDMGVMGAVVAMTLAWALMALRGFWAIRDSVAVRLVWNWPVLKNCLKLGIKGYLANLFQFFNYRLDILLLSFFMGVTPVGLYTTAVLTAEVLWYAPKAVATVLLPKTASASEAEARSFTPLVSRAVFLLTLGLAFPLAVLSYPVIVVMFGKQYEGSVLPLQLLLPGVILLGLAKVWASDLGGRGLLLYNTLGSLTGLVATVILDLLLIPRWGIDGAAVASAISYTLSALVILLFYLRASGSNFWDMLLPKRTDWDLYRTGWLRMRNLLFAKREYRY